MRELRLEENLIGTPKRIKKKINLVKKKILAENTISAEITPFVVRKKTKNIRQHWRGILRNTDVAKRSVNFLDLV